MSTELHIEKIPFHTLSVDEAVMVLGLDLEYYDDGLSQRLVEQMRNKYGSNEITVAEGLSWVSILIQNFLNVITAILAVVGGVSIWLEDWGELGVVIFVILFNGILGFYQEYGAEKSAAALRQMTQGTAKLRRDDVVIVVDINEVVVGDIVILDQGTCIPADCRVIESHNLAVKEDILTGEPDAVHKHTNRITKAAAHHSHDASHEPSANSSSQTTKEHEVALGDRLNMVYRNTTVTNGAGVGLVTAVGVNTELGRITKSLGNQAHEDTQLQKSMSKLMYALFACCSVIVIIVFAVNKWDTSGPTILYACSVGIAILPECLLAVMTVAMTVSMKRMADLKCIVRKLNALEVLASVTNICSDKTGTLTQNIMTVQYVLIGFQKLIKIEAPPRSSTATMWVSGTGQKQHFSPEAEEGVDAAFSNLLRCAALNSSTQLERDDETGVLRGAGNPSEIAIDSFCWQCNVNQDTYLDNGYFEKGVIPFDSATKMMIVGYVHRSEAACDSFVMVKGAPEIITEKCSKVLMPDGSLAEFTPEIRQVVEQVLSDLSKKALRCVAFAEREKNVIELSDKDLGSYDSVTLTQDLIFLGLCGIHDPPRNESLDSVQLCQAAGIKVHMLTGDHLNTANVIAHRIGILGSDAKDEQSTSGPKFDSLTDAEIDAMPELPSVIGRCSPQSKVRMIEALHRRGAVCVMTGDGFNDAQSIKAADIGCAMGSGTDATKGVAELIITDDNFASIVRAISEGRRIRVSIAKFVTHLLSGNVAQVIVLVIGLAIQINGLSQYVISPVQILWLNVFTGAPPATGLTMDLPDDDIMLRPPSRGTIMTTELICDTLISGTFLGLSALCSFLVVYFGVNNGPHPLARDCNAPSAVYCNEVWTARTTAFIVLYLGLQVHAYNVRHSRKSILQMRWVDNPWLWGSTIFNIAVLIPLIYIPVIAEQVFLHAEISWQWGVSLAFLVIFVGSVEIYKLIKNRLFPLKLGVVELPPELSRHETIVLKQHYPSFDSIFPKIHQSMAAGQFGSSFAAVRREVQSSYKEVQQNTASVSRLVRRKMHDSTTTQTAQQQ